MRILVASNMYPSERTPCYGSFAKNQVESLKALVLDDAKRRAMAEAGRSHSASHTSA